jgi:hypothetical protein
VLKDGVFDLFKKDVAERGPQSLLDELLSMARFYGQFVNPDNAEGTATRDVLADLVTLRAVMCYTPLLAARRFAVAEEDFVRFARLAETLTFRYSTICGKGSKDLEGIYHRAARSLWDSGGKDVATARKILIDAMPGREEFLAAFRRQFMGQKYIVDYVLRKIEASLDTEEKATRSTKAVHVEHILPQSPNDDWKAVLGARLPEHEAYVNRWGNLTLLGGKKNVKASNFGFEKKRAIYETSAIQLTKRLATGDNWSLDAIEQRQAELAMLADTVWTVPKE